MAAGLASVKQETHRIVTILLPLAFFYLLLCLETSRIPEPSISQASVFTSSSKTGAVGHEGGIENRVPFKPVSTATETGREVQDRRLKNRSAFISSTERQLPECARGGKPAKSFLVIFMGHSGSSAIMSELEAHSQTFTGEREPVDHYKYEFNTTLALTYTRDFFSRGIVAGKVPGFKMRPNHIKKAPEAWAALAKEFKTRIVWQYRDNILKQAVGEYSYKHLNDTSVIEGLRSKEDIKNRCNKGVGCKFSINNFDVFHQTLTDCVHSDLVITRGVHLIANGSSCVHALPYEDYLYDREGTMQRLRNFLGLGYEKTAPERYKATNDNLCRVVKNWEALCANFYGCHIWRHMFDDQRNECSCRFSTGHVKYCDAAYRG